ncbi:HopJ type III effector protein [Candidatus Ruthia endofausta]
MHQLTLLETFYCFSQYYQEVLSTPNGNSHSNIRNFITYS